MLSLEPILYYKFHSQDKTHPIEAYFPQRQQQIQRSKLFDLVHFIHLSVKEQSIHYLGTPLKRIDL